MSVLSRTSRSHPARQPEPVLPRQRTSSPVLPPSTSTPRRRRRAAGLLSLGVLVAAAAGAGATVLTDDRTPSGPARTAVEISSTELARDRAMENRNTAAQILQDRIARELRRDRARAGVTG